MRTSPLKSYLYSLLLVLAATSITIGVRRLLGGDAPLIFFTLAVILAAALGGMWPGLFATAASAGIIFALFRGHVFSLISAPPAIVLFTAFGVAASFAIQRVHAKTLQLEIAKQLLEDANQKLSRANEDLQTFAYSAAHDLNGPLRGIALFTQLLVKRNADIFDSESTKFAEAIVTRAKRMEELIRGLLEYAIATDKPNLSNRVDTKALVEQAIQELDFLIRPAGAQIIVGPLPVVHATEGPLLQVFWNLLSNALKYCDPLRPARVEISAQEVSTEWVFRVQDNGIGIDMKFSDQIFELFKRLHGEKEYQGHGIGLALCKKVIEGHGGRMWVESEPGKGATFLFTLPKPPAAT